MTKQEIAEMYATKRRFVDMLSEAYELAGVVTKITYTRDPERDMELVHIEYPGGGVHRINVSHNSNIATGKEIANQIYGIDAVGLIRQGRKQ